jgi:iron complex outermembrane receptor protein
MQLMHDWLLEWKFGMFAEVKAGRENNTFSRRHQSEILHPYTAVSVFNQSISPTISQAQRCHLPFFIYTLQEFAMQSVFNQQPKLRLSSIALACQLACFAVAANAQTATEKVDVDAGQTREVVIRGTKTQMGLMVQEDAPKARSTITAAELEKQRPTGNAYQALELLPSVNSYNYDATGLFGGGLTLRGFNSDQIGATINGVPVNDSGSFAIYPQEYVDQENTCAQTVTQGSTDVDSPQVGASGGNFSITTCNPEDKQRVRVMQTIGQLNMYKTYVRYDTGLFPDGKSKAFVSVSRAAADKWKGEGEAARTHVDAGFNYDWDKANFIHATLLWNQAKNNNIQSYSLADINRYGYDYDFAPTYIGNQTPVAGTAQTLATRPTTANPAYYKLAINPFKNAIASAIAKFRVSENVDLKVVPYFWYGFGTGGTQQNILSESGFLNGNVVNGRRDLNGDGDTLDTVIVANSSVTKTTRPGVTTSLSWDIGNHTILGGFWYERAKHRQTGPAELVDNNGNFADPYLRDDQILRPSGRPYESRDWQTVSTAYQAFVQDTMSFMDDKLTVNVGVRAPHIKRDFNNYANEAAAFNYKVERSYSDVLPQFGVRYRLTSDDQIYASIAKNFKAPGNFIYSVTSATGSGIVRLNPANGSISIITDVKPETSYSFDAGLRHQTSVWNGTFGVYATDFRDRLATSFDPVNLTSTTLNVGKVKNYGFEIEAGNNPINGWSVYGSYGYNKSEIKSDLPGTATVTLPTAGNEFPLTPKQKAGLSLQYENGALWGRVTAKATGKQQATLTNDQEVPGYTLFGFDGGYTFENFGFIKRPKLTINVSNITDKQYRNPSSQSVLNALQYGPVATGVSPKNVFYYLGAPRFVSATLSVDF